jgi:glycosyltransferase involved in cell wall biosynthesis
MTIPKVAFIFTHRIQYFTNLLDELHKRGNIVPFAIYAHDTKQIDDVGFGRRIEWDNRVRIASRELLLEDTADYPHGPFRSGYSRMLSSALRSFEPQVVHLNGYGHSIQWQAWLWARRHSLPIFLRGDGDTLGKRNPLSNSANRLLARMFTRCAGTVFFQGEENRKFWRRNGARPGNLRWIPCVSDTHIFQKRIFPSDEARSKFRKEYGAEADDVVFVVSGKLDIRKRPADAMRALKLCEELPARLWFVGSGPLECDLKEMAGDLLLAKRVVFWGFRNQTELPSILQAADVLIHPSQRDPWPYAILEGAHSGLALLLSDRVGSHPDWIANYKAGEIFKCGDIGLLAKLIRVAVTNEKRRSHWQQAASAAAQNYNEMEFCRIFEDAARTAAKGK